MVVTKYREKGEKGNCCLKGTEFQICKISNVQEMFHNVNAPNTSELFT